jgi:ParB family transcriptional regulator, chromosome partitioning protein
MERIEVRRIHHSCNPLRDALRNIDELAKSIEEKGLLQPIIIRPSKKGCFEIIAGNRRFAACKLIKWKKMPCYITDLDDKNALEVSIIENVQHQSLSQIEEARAFKRYAKEHGYGAISELGRRIGKSPSYISRRIALLDLPEDLQKKLLRNGKSFSIAEELIPLNDEYRNEVGRLILDTNVTSSQVRKIVRNIKEKDEDLSSSCNPLEYTRQLMIDRALTKCNASLKVCMMRFDEALDYLDKDEWVLWDVIMQCRIHLHQQVDALIRLEKKTRKLHRSYYKV